MQDLVVFAKAKLGVKWSVPPTSPRGAMFTCPFRNMFSSDKMLQMSYAVYQCAPNPSES